MYKMEVGTVPPAYTAPSRTVRGLAVCLLVSLMLVSGNPSSLAPWLAGYQAIIAISGLSIVCAAFMGKATGRTKLSAVVWIFLTFLLFSAYVSIERTLTLNTLVVYAILAVAILALLRYMGPKDVASCLVWVGISALIASLALAIISPGRALEAGMLSGIYSHKNILGFMLAIAFTANLYRSVPANRLSKWLVGIFLISGVVLTDSTTAMLACVFSAGIGLYLHMHSLVQSRVARGSLTLVMLLFTGIAIETILNESGAILSLLGKSPTLSARTGIWEFVTFLWLQRPMTGYGFGAVWSDDSQMRIFIQETLRNPAATHAHNGYLDIVLQTGIIGAVCFCAILLSGLIGSWRLINSHDDVATRLPFALLAFMLFYNVAESRFYNPAGWAVIIILSVLASSTKIPAHANK